MITPADLLSKAPAHLSERTRPLSGHTVQSGAYILYWMHHAVRAHENPALDMAVWLGNHLQLPVLVYQGLSGRHRYNSDRHHTFIMEGACDVQQALNSRNIAYAFHLAFNPDSPSPLQQLCNNAALVISEDFPAPPFPTWTQRIADKTPGPFWVVDAHCSLPMQSHKKFYPRAFQFRDATKSAFASRVHKTWEDIDPNVDSYTGPLPFEPLDLTKTSIPALCAQCDIDHSIGPVHHTAGGTSAGYQRWALFKSYGLKQYSQLRNDATVLPPRGVSRLSPYLHHGHVSPFRIAREAAADGSAGAEKFLDELLIWRELAFNFCFHHRDIESINVLPGWARDTLSKHSNDTRDQLYTWQQLAHAETDDPLWNAAQQSLRTHGELHNNIRMTWGKAVLRWTQNPQEALKLMIDLNHRYALDGSDPNSYAGLLWCLGLFDRPFQPEIPIYGSIRPRSTKAHADRIDMDKYTKHVNRSTRTQPISVAIIGAGMAGLTAGNVLSQQGYKVQVFDKARGPGGRMATRRIDQFAFDHGAQYFTARDPRFRRFVDSWESMGLVESWAGQIGVVKDGQLGNTRSATQRYVGTPRMSALTRHLSTSLSIAYQTRIAALIGNDGLWQLQDEAGDEKGQFDAVIVTTPPEQAVPLVAESAMLTSAATSVKMQPCWALMAVFEEALSISYDGLFAEGGSISWAARNNSKPGRPQSESWVIHASPAWSAEHLELDKEAIPDRLLPSFFSMANLPPVSPVFVQAHRWRFALAENPMDTGCLWDEDLQIAVCGDWCNSSRVEGAFLSGAAAAGRIMGIPDTVQASPIGIQATLF